ncbi:MAG: heavy metal translocating P-type ATPase, partial [Bosea sp. (in: a-proteobacteria)]
AAGTFSWKVGGMDCAGCAAKIRGALERMPGVSDVKLAIMTETLSLSLDESKTLAAKIETQVQALGYTTKRIEAKPVAATAEVPAAGCGCGHDHHDHGGKKDHDDHKHSHKHDHGAHDHADGGAAVAATGAVLKAESGVDAGHGAPGHVHEATPHGMSWWQTAKGRLVLVTGALLAGAWVLKFAAGEQIAYWGFVAACLIGVTPVAKRAIAAARAGMPFTIEMLMTIAAAGALVIGAAEEAALVVFLFAVGEVLEGVAADRARASIKALGDLVPKTAIVEENGTTRQVAASALVIGQTLLVRPGDRIPADGDIIDGISAINEAPVTGESVPKTKSPGDSVFAGSINTDAALRVKMTKGAEDNTIARIIRLVEEAQEARAPTERFIDRFSRIYMPAIVGLALLVMVIPPLFMGGEWGTWIYRALALLLIGCPCALVISVPASIASSLSAGARRGLLLKGGSVIEAAAKTSIVAFDKTGTLTVGRPEVTDIVGFGASEAEVLTLAAAVETGSSHPLAEAILARAASEKLALPTATGAKAIPGRGVEARIGDEAVFVGSPRFASETSTIAADVRQTIDRLEGEGKTVAAVFRAARIVGLIALRDEARDDAKAAITELKALGISSVMLTGDNARTGAAIAGALGMDHRAELLPDDKVAEIKRLTANAGVMMVGDGINDAPALAAASLGVAMGSGTDVALETADAALLRSRVTDVPRMIRLSRATMSNIHVNITIALGLKAVFLVTSVLGYTGLWVAILADTGATVLVTLNALRLLGFNPDNRG